jgi:hypothetical protein
MSCVERHMEDAINESIGVALLDNTTDDDSNVLADVRLEAIIIREFLLLSPEINQFIWLSSREAANDATTTELILASTGAIELLLPMLPASSLKSASEDGFMNGKLRNDKFSSARMNSTIGAG